MPLTIRLRPGERLIVNGAVLRNGSTRAVALEVLNKVTTLHERDLILPEQADSALKQLYLQIQMMHLEPESHEFYYKPFVKLSAMVFADEMRTGNDARCTLVTDLIALVGQRNFPAALRRLQKEIGHPGDERSVKMPDNPK
jgi:flagellar biosynthesis regulator FlbT